jgi:hypothetical protein
MRVSAGEWQSGCGGESCFTAQRLGQAGQHAAEVGGGAQCDTVDGERSSGHVDHTQHRGRLGAGVAAQLLSVDAGLPQRPAGQGSPADLELLATHLHASASCLGLDGGGDRSEGHMVDVAPAVSGAGQVGAVDDGSDAAAGQKFRHPVLGTDPRGCLQPADPLWLGDRSTGDQGDDRYHVRDGSAAEQGCDTTEADGHPTDGAQLGGATEPAGVPGWSAVDLGHHTLHVR